MGAFENSSAWQPYLASAQVISGYATAIAVLTGATSLFFILIQIVLGARASREAIALESHKSYIVLCIENPDLSSSTMALKYIRTKDFNGILDTYSERSEKYLWFISYVLYSMQQILQMSSFDRSLNLAWRQTVLDQLGYHEDILRVVWPVWRLHYGVALDLAVHQALKVRPGTLWESTARDPKPL